MSNESASITFSLQSSFDQLYDFAARYALIDLANNDSFVEVLYMKVPENTERYFDLINLVTDMLHDHFVLTSGQRRGAEKARNNR